MTDLAHIVKILETEWLTHDVRRFAVERPPGYSFESGQATDVSVYLPEWENKRNPFTFTSLNEWDHLEFSIKVYPERHGVTNQLSKLEKGGEIILHDVFGAIQYKGEGIFIAGGAGVTPFISILRRLREDRKLGKNQLYFSNKSEEDIILRREFTDMLSNNFINTITREKSNQFENRKIDRDYLKEKIKDFNCYFYVCGPDPMVDDLKQTLLNLGVEKSKLITEEF
jgi:ferredoxin-NADP reductase